VSELIWIRHEFPWIGSGFILVHQSAGSLLRTRLRELGFTMFELQDGQMNEGRSLYAALAREFAFPDYYGHKWDAFNDSWAEIDPDLPSPAAVLWHEGGRNSCSRAQALLGGSRRVARRIRSGAAPEACEAARAIPVRPWRAVCPPLMSGRGRCSRKTVENHYFVPPGREL
jgi:hypothetical protein